MKHAYTAVRFRRLKRSYAGSSNEMHDFTSCTTRTTWQGPLSNKQTKFCMDPLSRSRQHCPQFLRGALSSGTTRTSPATGDISHLISLETLGICKLVFERGPWQVVVDSYETTTGEIAKIRWKKRKENNVCGQAIIHWHHDKLSVFLRGHWTFEIILPAILGLIDDGRMSVAFFASTSEWMKLPMNAN